jgi:hypothetical protein
MIHHSHCNHLISSYSFSYIFIYYLLSLCISLYSKFFGYLTRKPELVITLIGCQRKDNATYNGASS